MFIFILFFSRCVWRRRFVGQCVLTGWVENWYIAFYILLYFYILAATNVCLRFGFILQSWMSAEYQKVLILLNSHIYLPSFQFYQTFVITWFILFTFVIGFVTALTLFMFILQLFVWMGNQTLIHINTKTEWLKITTDVQVVYSDYRKWILNHFHHNIFQNWIVADII